jgi:hypothetical protein
MEKIIFSRLAMSDIAEPITGDFHNCAQLSVRTCEEIFFHRYFLVERPGTMRGESDPDLSLFACRPGYADKL